MALDLTRRQAEILAWLAFGKTDAEIGRILGISPKTVSHTIGRIYRKLGVESRVAATLRAVRAAGSRKTLAGRDDLA
ncbi:MAG: helix-turn-helix transcriptional regulator [Alphaproteobacteria bacterium]|nr:helix-turn-helix transcriptional regulator [Alphaproteobacteria bacterium]